MSGEKFLRRYVVWQKILLRNYNARNRGTPGPADQVLTTLHISGYRSLLLRQVALFRGHRSNERIAMHAQGRDALFHFLRTQFFTPHQGSLAPQIGDQPVLAFESMTALRDKQVRPA
jgi:hypothetical protein